LQTFKNRAASPREDVHMLETLVLLAVLADVKTDIDAFARKALDTVGTTPGMTVVVVKDDRIVYRGDFGMRDVEAGLPVTPETRFYIGSTTKTFTGMTALVLAEEGKVDLDAPVTTYWPELKLTPPLDASRFTLRDFLAMRPGLANDTWNFRWGSPANINDDAELMRVLLTYSREEPRRFDYSNMAYNFAAKVLERATGKRWQDLTEEKVFAPLGMSASTSDVPEGNVSGFYRSSARNVFVRNTGKVDANMQPAGGTFTTSGDAAKWLIAMMNGGRLGGKQVLPKRAVQIAMSPQTTRKARYNYFDRWAWGIGQDIGEYEGDALIHRPGGFHGAYSHVSFMPEHRIGVAVFSNGGNLVADAVAAYAYDRLLGKKDLDAKWSKELERLAANAQKSRDERNAAAVVTRGTAGRALAQYTGAYRFDRLGGITVEREADKLFARWGILRAELIPIGGDEFSIDWESEGAPVKVKFVFDERGRAERFQWDQRVWTRINEP
jgi:CubicO group peptidase (beta-lactamase class C family)